MKTLLTLIVATCLAAAASSNAFAKAEKTTLSDFKGSYTGTATLASTAITFSGPVSLTFSANKTGKSGSINLSGSGTSGVTTVPISAAITLAKGVLSIDNFVFNTIQQGSLPGTASYTVGKNRITFQGSATVMATTYPFTGTIVTKTKGSKQTITFTTTELFSSNSVVFTFTVSRKLKKSEL